MKPVPSVKPSATPTASQSGAESGSQSAAQVSSDQHGDSHRPLLPHERDEKPDKHPSAPSKIMKQAFQDIQRGLVDTDLHGQRGVENVVKKSKNSEGKK